MSDDRRPVPPRAGAAGGEVHGDLGRRPRGRAAAHVRGPAARPRSQDRAPRIVETRRGHQVWEFEGQRYTQVGMNAVAGPAARDGEDGAVPLRPDAARLLRRRRPRPRHGHQRRVGVGELPVADHRVLRQRVLRRRRPRARRRVRPRRGTTGCSRSGTSRIPIGSCRSASRILADPQMRRRRDPPQRRTRLPLGDVPRTTARDRPAVAVGPRPLGPDHRGVRGDRHRDLAARRAARACTRTRRTRPRSQLAATLFGQLSLGACAEWLWSEYPVQHPDLKIAMSEGRHRLGRDAARPARLHRRPLELRRGLGRSGRPTCCKRNFWFCTLEDPSTIDTRHRIGVENIMVEVDYPHGDSTWPDTQLVIERRGATCPSPSCARCAARTRPRSTATRSPTVVLPR